MGDETVTEADDVQRCFERQADATPHAIAIVHDGEVLCYGELRRRAADLAGLLRARGVVDGTLVAVCLPRSFDLIASLLAVLEAGGTYVPIDPTYPRDRATAIVHACRPAILLTRRSHLDRVAHADVPSLFLDQLPAPPPTQPTTRGRPIDPATPAYLLFTSGSTGTPKGVLVSRGALANFTAGAARAFGVTAADRVLQFASISWDTSAEEIWPCLTQGGTLVLRTDAMTDPWELAAACRRHALTLLDLPTAFFPGFIEAVRATSVPPSLRAVVIGGERVTADRVLAWRQAAPGVRLLNSYGVTEATAITTWCDLTDDSLPGGLVAIGCPLPRVTVHLLDGDVAPVGRGSAGELTIGGAGVAIGYLGRPDLTAERFVPDPFAGRPGARMYRTGDMARERPDGKIEYLGRDDDQVKIRGVRVELGDVEAALRRHPGVHDAIALAEERSHGERRLVAYVAVGDGPDPPAGASIRRWLAGCVPDFLVPASIAVLARLPLLASGKVDRRALPREHTGADQVGAGDHGTSGTIGTLRAIWRELLGETAFLPADRFFERGGNSLNVVTLRMQLLRRLGVDVPAADIYRNDSLEDMAALVERGLAPERAAPGGGRTPVTIPLSPSQNVLFEETSIASIDANNLEFLVSVERPAREVLLAIAALLRRHDVFCIDRFLVESGARVQRIQARPVSQPLVADAPARGQSALRQAVLAARRRISVANGRLYQWLVHEDAGSCQVYFIGNHLLFDAISVDVLRDELDFLLAEERPRLPSTASFREWIETTGGPRAIDRHRRSLPMWRKHASWAPIVDRVVDHVPGQSGLDLVERVLARAATGAPRAPLRGRQAVLLGACAHAFAGLFAAGEVPCRVVHSGRNQVPGLNDSMTLGWLAHHVPLRIAIGVRTGVEETIRRTEAALAEVGDDSAGYGWLRHGAREPALAECLALGQLPLYFNYLPDVRSRPRAITCRADLLPPMPEARSSAVGLSVIVEERADEPLAPGSGHPTTKVTACFDRSNMRAEVASRFLDDYAQLLQRRGSR